MKIELEWPEDIATLNYIYAPAMEEFTGSKSLRAYTGWLIHAKLTSYPHYFGCFGKGPTPQAAMDDAVRQLRDRLARYPQGDYNVNVPGIDLDLSGLLDGL